MKVAISGDVLRSYENGGQRSRQNGNIIWLYTLLSAQIKRVVGCAPDLITGDLEHFDLWKAYSYLGRETSVQSWAAVYECKNPPQEFINYVYVIYGSFDLVIFFEAPTVILRSFEKLGIGYIDIVLHPVRFLGDLAMALRSNIPSIAERIRQFHIDDDLIYAEASLLVAGCRKDKVACSREIRSVFFGQTDDDKTLIHNGKFINFSSAPHLGRIQIKNNERYAFKPHPFNESDFGIYEIGIEFSKLNIIKDNFYRLMAMDNIENVISVTSSVSIEARYFGKNGIHLGQYPFRFFPEYNSHDSYVPVCHEWLSMKFWAFILGFEDDETAVRRGFIGESRLRLSLRSSWGYSEVSTAILPTLK